MRMIFVFDELLRLGVSKKNMPVVAVMLAEETAATPKRLRKLIVFIK